MTQTADMVTINNPVRDEPAHAVPRLRVGYLTTAYPAVSHTFIRREIEELERRGHEVVRFSIRRSGSTLVDPADARESQRTHYVLEQGSASLLAAPPASAPPLPAVARAGPPRSRCHARGARGRGRRGP